MAANELINTSLFNDANLVSYWRMEANSNDSKGANNGTDTTITYSAGNGKFGQGAGFNGTSSFIAIADHASLDITGALTITAWVKPNDATPNRVQVVFCKGDTNNAAGLVYDLTCNSRQVGGGVSNGTSFNSVTGGSTMSDNAYHHLAIVYVPSTSLTVYLDGVQDGQNTTTIISSIQSTADAAAIGRDGDVSQNFFKDNIDECAIFSRALTATEIRELALGTAAEGDFKFI